MPVTATLTATPPPLVLLPLLALPAVGVKWISSMAIHRSGDHVLTGSYDRRVCWMDLDLSSKPYKVGGDSRMRARARVCMCVCAVLLLLLLFC